MKKRLWSILLVACMMLTLLPFGALAANEVVWSTSANDTVLMVSCDGDGIMPGYTAKAPEWSTLKDKVTTVIVQDNVTKIGASAFKGFTKLETVSVPESVTEIGDSAFEGCTALKSISLPKVVIIDDNAFKGCSKLETVTLGAPLTTVHQNAFKGTGVKDVYFGGKTDKWNLVKKNAGTGNDPLFDADQHVICDTHTPELKNAIKNTCEEKGYSGDKICKVCGTVIEVGSELPSTGHDWLKWKVINKVGTDQEGLERRICYNDNNHVEEVQIPARTVYAPDRAELLSEATESITVPNTRGNILWLKWIAEGMPAAKADTENPFDDVKKSDVCYDAVMWALGQEGLISKAQVDSKKFSPSDVLTAQQVADIAGEGTLPVSGFENDVPHEVTYKPTAKEWVIPAPTEMSDANFVYVVSSDGKTASIKSYKGDAEKVTIPEKLGGIPVVGIREKAFQNKTKMTEVTIPATVTSIGADAFNGCSKLASVTIPEAVTSIGARAFKGCAALTSVVVPEGVASIGSEAFAGCDKVTSITLPKSLKTLGKDALPTKALKDVYFQSGKQDWNNLKYAVAEGVTVHYAEDASPLTWEPTADGKGIRIIGCQNVAADVVIPATLDGLPVTEIDPAAFNKHNKITSVSIPEGVTEIEKNTFTDCTALKSVTLPKSLTKVDNNAFDGTKLKDVYYGGTLKDWDDLVFIKAGNEPLQKATIHPADCVEHQTELKDAVAATCTEKGFSGNKVCKVCGKTIEEGKEVEALGHDWGEWTVTKAATATEKGEETRVCKRDPAHTEKKDIAPTGEPTENFTDVNPGDWFYKAVVWAVNAKPAVTTGTTLTTFAPYNNCTRAEMVTFLYRAAGQPAVTNTVNPFTDVTAADWFYNAVLWAVQEKITTGTTPTTFSPNVQVSRAESVTFLWRYAKSPVVVTANPFTDVASAEWYYNAVLWAVQSNITTGTTPTTFEPTKVCTRSEIVTFLYRDFNPGK